MTEPDARKYVIMREVVSDPLDAMEGLIMITEACKVVEAVYIHGVQRLDLHVPDEDMVYQLGLGGTPEQPVLRGMVNAEGNLVCGMTCHMDKLFFKRFAEVVVPVFTSVERLNMFIAVLRQNRYAIPTDRVVEIRLTEGIKRGILDGQIMVNPLPEVFMGTFPLFDKDSNRFTLVKLGSNDSPSTQKTALSNDHNNRGLIYLQEHRLENAIREFRAALTQSPDHAEAHHNLGVAHMQKCEWDEAIREFQAALRIIPNDAETHNALGVAYGEHGQFDDAIREYQTAVWLKPDYDKAQYNLRGTYEQRDEQDETVRDFRERLKTEENNDVRVFVHLGLGSHYATQNRMDDAIREFKAAVYIAPNDEMAHWTLGITYEAIQQWDAAIEEWETVLRINPDNHNVYKRMGFAYIQKGSWNNAVRRFQIVLRFNPDDAEAHYYLAHLYRQKGQWNKAVSEARIALRLGFEPAHQLLAELQT